MADLDCSVEIAHVQSSLSRAWRFLSGERRVFEYRPAVGDAPRFADFSFFMPLTIATRTRQGGVGVLMQRGDATQVASYMFGAARDQVDDADLHDACAEVCNVLSDCVAMHFGAEHAVKLGLPQCASATETENIVENNVATAVYQGCTGAHRLWIVLYDSLSLPS